jgi:hypothetical protein
MVTSMHTPVVRSPAGPYTNLNPDGTPKAVPDLPVIGALAQNYTVLDDYFSQNYLAQLGRGSDVDHLACPRRHRQTAAD